jgi:superfamily II DNA or RNA helicase
MTLRDQRQLEFANEWLKTKWGILNLCPRFGKIRTTINIMNKMKPVEVLIAYPDNKIKESWQKDFQECNYTNSFITYTTHLSLHKYQDYKYDLVVIDEIHLLSEAQIEAVKELKLLNKCILGLTGTLSEWTERMLGDELSLGVVAEYPISQAIEENVITDYQITVVKVPLDDITINDYKGKKRTEKKQFDSYAWVIDSLERQGKATMFLRLARMRIIQSSLAKLKMTKQILSAYKNERILVFCGTTKIADSLGIPSHHSKSKDDETFTDFTEGEGNHMAVVKIGNTGVTYKPLNRVIINYFDSNGENLAQKINRCMAFEYDNPEKKAQIYIISSTEEVELKWLKKALEFFDKSKIKYV